MAERTFLPVLHRGLCDREPLLRPEETAAVRLAQQRAGLLVTGTVDRTWAAL